MTARSPHSPVVVGVDASAAALRAVRFAAEEARLRDAPLHVVHATAWPFADLTTAPADLDVAGLVRDAADELLRSAVASAAADHGGEVTATVADGDPVAVLRDASAGAALVVVGSRGAGGVAGLVLGSTAAGLVASAQCPVVVLPDDTAAVVHGRRSVVVGVEGRGDEEEVLAFAFAEAAARGTDLLAVHAWRDVTSEVPHRPVSPLVDWAGVLSDEDRALSEALAGWRDKEPDVVVREAVVRDRTARALVSAGLTAELLVVGHRARRWLNPTTHGVLHRATCPVAVVPVAAAARMTARSPVPG